MMNTVSCLPTFVNIAQIQSMFHVFWCCNVFWWYCMDFWWFLMIFWGISSKIIKSHQHRTKIWKTKKFRPEKRWFIFTRTRQRLAKKHSERSPLQIWSFQKQSGESQKWWIMGRMFRNLDIESPPSDPNSTVDYELLASDNLSKIQ